MDGFNNLKVSDKWRRVLTEIGFGRELAPEHVAFAMDQIMSGESDDVHTSAFAFGLFAKGITPVELDAAATGMLSFSRPVEDTAVSTAVERGAVDIVGTGGDGAATVNISTMSAVVIAASGVPVIKHGNRAASSKSGGADMLEALGIDISDGVVASSEHPEFFLRFLFAARYHPAMRYAGPVRKELGVPTLFNILGPLTNPAQPGASLIGCAFPDQIETMARTYARRNQQVVVVRGSDGLDEVTVTGPTRAFLVSGGEVEERVIDPKKYGIAYGKADSLRGGDPNYNAEVALKLWANELSGPIRDAVVLNSAAAIVSSRGWQESGFDIAMEDAIALADATISSRLCSEIINAAVQR